MEAASSPRISVTTFQLILCHIQWLESSWLAYVFIGIMQYEPLLNIVVFVIIDDDDIIIIVIVVVVSCHRPFLPGTSLEPTVIPTTQASSFTLQYFPYYV
jgi:hypothetical protein